jgi:hypothetical protein
MSCREISKLLDIIPGARKPLIGMPAGKVIVIRHPTMQRPAHAVLARQCSMRDGPPKTDSGVFRHSSSLP